MINTLPSEKQLSEHTLDETDRASLNGQASQRCFGKPISNKLYASNIESLKQVVAHAKQSNATEPELKCDITNDLSVKMQIDILKDIELGRLSHYETLYRPLILSNMLKSEQLMKVENQQTADKRNLIVNWLALIHTKYSFQPETLHEAANIFNRYLTLNSIEEAEYQKLGLACLWMSAKMEQRSIKTLKAWLAFGRGFTTEELIEMEARILECLDFKLSLPTPLTFFQLFSTYYDMNSRTINLCNYIVQLTLIDCSYIRYKGSLIGLAAIYLAFKILGLEDWNDRIIELIQVKLEDIRQCAQQLCKSIQTASSNPLSSIYRKYSSRKYHQVAKIKFGRKGQ